MKNFIIPIGILLIYVTLYVMDFSSLINPDPRFEPNECLIYSQDPGTYVTNQAGWPQQDSPFNPIQEGKTFKQTWLNSAAHKKNKNRSFLLGASSSAYQIEGGLDANNATAQFYLRNGLQPAGKAIDFWNRYEDDIKQMKNELGINSFRLSIAWDRVEPQQGEYNMTVIEQYISIVKTCKSYGIEPIITLHQYTIPVWFEEIGGFEKAANNFHFVEFAKTMYEALHSHVAYWSTFNAPEAYAIKGYATGENSPGIKNNWQMVQQVLINMLDTHVAIYQAIKGKNGLYKQYKTRYYMPNPQIGIQKNIIMMDVSTKTIGQICLSPISAACCGAANMLQNDIFYLFFSRGKVGLWIPTKVNIVHSNPLAPSSLDWIGINFYSNMAMKISKPQEETDPELSTQNPRYRNYPEGLARAVQQIHSAIAQPLNIPIIITENGIATGKNEMDELKRKRFFQRALFTLRVLLKQGYNLIGYLPWSSHDSYEWPTQEFPDPFGQRLFGFFTVDHNSYVRTLKQSSQYYHDFIKGYEE
jgi:beta-glucosidase